MFASCAKEETGKELPLQNADAVRFEIGFAESRVATDKDFNSTWEEGDAIGLFVVENGQPLAASGNPAHNVKLTYTGGNWVLENEILWEGRMLDFYAYYPYDAAMTDPTNVTFKVQEDQSAETGGKSNYGLSDLLTAQAKGVIAGNLVTLQFSHQMAMVQVKLAVTNKGTVGLTLKNVKTSGVLNLAQGLTVSDDMTGDVVMRRVEQEGDADYASSYTFRALVPAQGIEETTALFEAVEEEKTHEIDGPADGLALTAGMADVLSLRLPTALPSVFIEAAGRTFQMMSTSDSGEATWFDVTLTQNYYMGVYEVTNIQYAEFLNANEIGSDGIMVVDGEQVALFDASKSVNLLWNNAENEWAPVSGKEHYPVAFIHWRGAREYALWIGGDLPTEAQWEFACRAGTTTGYYYGENPDNNWIYGNYKNELGDYCLFPPGMSEVGQFEPNPWGLYDMYGNASEWVLDNFSSPLPHDPVTDPYYDREAAGNDSHVIKGGAYGNNNFVCTTTYRAGSLSTGNSRGFRVMFPAE